MCTLALPLFSVALASALILTASAAQPDDATAAKAAPESDTSTQPPPEIIASRQVAQQLGDALKTTLEQAMANGGPVNALAVCHEQAATLASTLSEQEAVLIGRTSLKLRNPANAPDSWETAVLLQFQARHHQGEPISDLEFADVIEDDEGKKTFRYMKAIPTAALCLQCHGESLSAEVDTKLKQLYPQDQARGFREGELRGAFTLSRPVP